MVSAGLSQPGPLRRHALPVDQVDERLTSVEAEATLREALALQGARNRSPHLEVETYTWSVLPERERRLPVEQAIARELEWVAGELS